MSELGLTATAVFWCLILGHAVADFALQNPDMAYGKNRRNKPRNVPEGQKPQTVWPYFLTGHAMIHGAIAGLITSSVLISIAETMAHWWIDFGKCENQYGIHADQVLHVVCKAMWVWLLIGT